MEELKKLNLLYVEDEVRTKDNYTKTFNIIFNQVFSTDNYEDAIEIFLTGSIDFILLDIELKSEKNGFDISKKVREINPYIPIVFLTGLDEKDVILDAINSNINGYIIKPLSINKFLEITKSLFKKKSNNNIISFKEYKYNFDTYELFNRDNELIKLGKKETMLLATFLVNKEKVLSREFLEFEIWEEPLDSDTTLKNLISSLRKKIGKEMIVNISKIGWKIETC
ncbi:response regulator transcription factor [Campylobacterota bacterium DY0563]